MVQKLDLGQYGDNGTEGSVNPNGNTQEQPPSHTPNRERRAGSNRMSTGGNATEVGRRFVDCIEDAGKNTIEQQFHIMTFDQSSSGKLAAEVIAVAIDIPGTVELPYYIIVLGESVRGKIDIASYASKYKQFVAMARNAPLTAEQRTMLLSGTDVIDSKMEDILNNDIATKFQGRTPILTAGIVTTPGVGSIEGGRYDKYVTMAVEHLFLTTDLYIHNLADITQTDLANKRMYIDISVGNHDSEIGNTTWCVSLYSGDRTTSISTQASMHDGGGSSLLAEVRGSVELIPETVQPQNGMPFAQGQTRTVFTPNIVINDIEVDVESPGMMVLAIMAATSMVVDHYWMLPLLEAGLSDVGVLNKLANIEGVENPTIRPLKGEPQNQAVEALNLMLTGGIPGYNIEPYMSIDIKRYGKGSSLLSLLSKLSEGGDSSANIQSTINNALSSLIGRSSEHKDKDYTGPIIVGSGTILPDALVEFDGTPIHAANYGTVECMASPGFDMAQLYRLMNVHGGKSNDPMSEQIFILDETGLNGAIDGRITRVMFAGGFINEIATNLVTATKVANNGNNRGLKMDTTQFAGAVSGGAIQAVSAFHNGQQRGGLAKVGSFGMASGFVGR